MKVLLSVRKGKTYAKKAKSQVAFLPISKPRNGPDVSVRNAIRISCPTAKLITAQPGITTRAPQQLCQPTSGKNRISTRPVAKGAALLVAATLSMLSAGQTEHAYMNTRLIPKIRVKLVHLVTLRNGSVLRKLRSRLFG
eukprot:3476145-Rhodomonas_salina.1